MPRMSNRFPRYILPESLQAGDLVRVTYPVENGLVHSFTGTVAVRKDRGRQKVWVNREGAGFLVWDPLAPKNKNPRVTLLARVTEVQQTLEMFDEIKERIE